MANSDKAYMWACNDFSDGEPVLDKLAARFKNAEQAEEFKKIFQAAQVFNKDAKDGKTDLVWADTVEDVEEV